MVTLHKISEPERDDSLFSIGLNGCLGHVDAHRRHEWRDCRSQSRSQYSFI